ncbi:HEAT repeat domain-containing protein, partial [Streptomyces sp. P01-B04]
PEGVGTAGPRDAAPVSGTSRTAAVTGTGAGPSTSPRILELLALSEGEPGLAALAPYLDDPDPAVRRAAVAALTESTPPGAGPALAAALADPAPAVRAAVAASLRELVEVLDPSPDLRTPLVTALSSDDPVVRAAALDTLRALRLGDAELFAGTLSDPDLDVRAETVRALVSVDAVGGLVRAASDSAREVRVAVAKGLAAVRSPAPGPLGPLLDDPDALVRAAALAALAGTGCPPAYAARAVAALADPAWQVRAGAATALSSADPERAVPPLTGALDDPNADVRKAAVLALLRHPGHAAAREALAGAVADRDADVRAYAGRGVGVNSA